LILQKRFFLKWKKDLTDFNMAGNFNKVLTDRIEMSVVERRLSCFIEEADKKIAFVRSQDTNIDRDSV
jgi:hypothetical protein